MYEYAAFALVLIAAGVASKLNMRAIQENLWYHVTWAIILAVGIGIVAAILPSPYPKMSQLDWAFGVAILTTVAYICGVVGCWIGDWIVEGRGI
jgi:divalent metal cation (Fe/Co/Zn/Cd) transporter